MTLALHLLMQNILSYKGAIFDVDGTLVDSNNQHAEAFQRAFRINGMEIPFERIRNCIGMGADKLIPALLGRPVSPGVQKRLEEAKAESFAKEFLSNVKPFPKVRDLLLLLRESGMKLAVASSASREDLEKLLKIAQVEDLFEGQATVDSARSSKPDPDILLAAAQKLGFLRRELVFFGDTPYDVEAARRAHIACIAFRSGGWSDAHLLGAQRVYGAAGDLYDELHTANFGFRYSA